MAQIRTCLLTGCVALTLACANDHLSRGHPGDGPRGATPDGNGLPVEPEGDHALEIAFNPMYSAYDGKHVFRVPVKVTGADGALTVRTTPDGFIDYEPSEVGVTLTTRRAGKATITIRDAAGNSGSATLTVTQNESSDVDVGRERYENDIGPGFVLPEGGLVFDASILPRLPEGGFPYEGGFRFPDGGIGIAITRRDGVPACIRCHRPYDNASRYSSVEAAGEYTPQQTGGYTDEELGLIITDAVKPARSHFRVVNRGGLLPDAEAIESFAGFHKFALGPETLRGVIAYLRGLEPKSLVDLSLGEIDASAQP